MRGSVLLQNEEYVGSKTGGRFTPRTLLKEVVEGDFSFTSEALQAPVAS
jgi:hypothetical protein